MKLSKWRGFVLKIPSQTRCFVSTRLTPSCGFCALFAGSGFVLCQWCGNINVNKTLPSVKPVPVTLSKRQTRTLRTADRPAVDGGPVNVNRCLRVPRPVCLKLNKSFHPIPPNHCVMFAPNGCCSLWSQCVSFSDWRRLDSGEHWQWRVTALWWPHEET